MLVSREDFLGILTPERRKFIMDCVGGGLGDYDNPQYYSPAARVDHNPSTQASIRNAHIVARAARANLSALGIRVQIIRGRVLFVVEDKVRISFKKFTRTLRSRNYPTHQALAFLGQTLEIRALTNIVAGYRADATATGFEVWITCPIDEDNYWQYQLSGTQVTELFEGGNVADDVRQYTVKRRKRVLIRQAEAGEQADEPTA